MTKPHVLQVGPYPEWDQVPLDAAFTMHRWLEAADKDGVSGRGRPEDARHCHARRPWGECGDDRGLPEAGDDQRLRRGL